MQERTSPDLALLLDQTPCQSQELKGENGTAVGVTMKSDVTENSTKKWWRTVKNTGQLNLISTGQKH
jgi:hypothetical protein